MSEADLQSCLGQRVLVSVKDADPQMTSVRAFSPKGQYVWLAAACFGIDDDIGWRHVSSVKVLEVIGADSVPPEQVLAGLLAARQQVLQQQVLQQQAEDITAAITMIV